MSRAIALKSRSTVGEGTAYHSGVAEILLPELI